MVTFGYKFKIMKKIALFLGLFCIALEGYSQVGINTTMPYAQLEIKSSNQVAPTNTDGLLIPKIDAFPATNPTINQNGMMVFLTVDLPGKLKGFYYWDNGTTTWIGVGGGKGWDIIGNSGTIDGTNFIGTTDNVPLNFKVNGQKAGRIESINFRNTFLGYQSGAANMPSMFQGINNSAFGYHSFLSNTTGYQNTAVGTYALENNTNGVNNSASGFFSLDSNTTGSNNTASGSFSLYSNVNGADNTAFGNQALQYNISANGNTAIGTAALNINIASENTAVGHNAMFNTLGGSSNAALGYKSLFNNSSGNNNTTVGYTAGAAITGSNNISIGANTDVATAAASNQMSIGNVIYGADMSTTALGKIGIGVTVPTEKLEVAGKTKTTNLQMTTGSGLGRLLVSDALGNGTWQNPGSLDAAFYEVGTTIPPNAITDNMYHTGNIGIGKITTSYKLDVEETNGANLSAVRFTHSNPTNTVLETSVLRNEITSPAALLNGVVSGTTNAVTTSNSVQGYGSTNFVNGVSDDAVYGTSNNVSATGTGFRFGTTNFMSGVGTGEVVGTRNSMNNISSADEIGVDNVFLNANTGVHIGVNNTLGGNGNGVQYGTRTTVNNSGSGIQYGSQITMNATGSGLKYGYYTIFPTATGGLQYGVYSDVISTNGFAGYFRGKTYNYNQQLTANGDGQYSIYGYRDRNSVNNGSDYTLSATNNAIIGYNLWGDQYTFGMAGFNDNDAIRTGGVLGAYTYGGYWGSLGYKNSASLVYGVYATAALATGTGRAGDNQSLSEFSIGGGFYGGLIGSWSKGNLIGNINSGGLFASYNSGDEYTYGKQIEIVATENSKIAVYTVTSTESVIYKKGKITLQNGSARVAFETNYVNLLGDIPVVTVSPMGNCNGLYIESVDANGFTIKELNNGSSNVSVSWIAVGDRIDANNHPANADVLDATFNDNINGVLFNENNKNQNAKAIWSNGKKIEFGNLPENLIQVKKDTK